MSDQELLSLNVFKVIRCLTPVISAGELGKIKAILVNHVQDLLKLSYLHLQYAQKAKGKGCWRQRVSRGYYCAYCASKAVRLAAAGVYIIDGSDHQKVGELPKNFPSRSTWEDFLIKYRGDRNLADYDHKASEKDLELKSSVYLKKTEVFCRVSQQFLIDQGIL